jgi:prolipoprotein diacylglyceryltransferase
MEIDLHMTDSQYLIALTIFYFSYAIFEVPSNVFLKRLRPSIWLSLLMFLWGVVMVNFKIRSSMEKKPLPCCRCVKVLCVMTLNY